MMYGADGPGGLASSTNQLVYLSLDIYSREFVMFVYGVIFGSGTLFVHMTGRRGTLWRWLPGG